MTLKKLITKIKIRHKGKLHLVSFALLFWFSFELNIQSVIVLSVGWLAITINKK